MDAKQAGSTLDSLIVSFNARITELQELIIARNMYPASSVSDLSAVDTALKSMEMQVQLIKERLSEETAAIPKAEKLIKASLQQQKRLQNMSLHVPSYLPERMAAVNLDGNRGNSNSYSNPTLQTEAFDQLGEKQQHLASSKLEPAALPKEKKGRAPPPLWYITTSELDSLPSYMRGRLTLDRVNACINDMAAYAEANAQLISAPKKKLAENIWERALELRDIAMTETVKGKHFFLETDMKGPTLKLDNTGKATLTVLRHLGRLSETRIGHNRVLILSKPQ